MAAVPGLGFILLGARHAGTHLPQHPHGKQCVLAQEWGGEEKLIKPSAAASASQADAIAGR